MSSYPVNSNWESWSADRRTYVVSKRARTGEPVSQRNHLIINDNDPCKCSKLSLSHLLHSFAFAVFGGTRNRLQVCRRRSTSNHCVGMAKQAAAADLKA